MELTKNQIKHIRRKSKDFNFTESYVDYDDSIGINCCYSLPKELLNNRILFYSDQKPKLKLIVSFYPFRYQIEFNDCFAISSNNDGYSKLMTIMEYDINNYISWCQEYQMKLDKKAKEN